MNQRIAIAAAVGIGIALGVLGTRLWPGVPSEPEAWAPQVVSHVDRPEPQLSTEPAEGAGKLPPPGILPPEAEEYPQYFEDLEDEEPEDLPVIPSRVDFPTYEKLAEPLSERPHKVIGAWDEDQTSERPGRRRAFVVVVDPEASDAEIEALARDIRNSHLDAPLLNVRIYDSEDDARVPGVTDGGERAFRHLVGEVKRNDAMGLDVIRVRGSRIDP